MEQASAAAPPARRRERRPTSAWASDLGPILTAFVSFAILATFGHGWLEHPTPLGASLILVWLFAVIMWGAIGVMNHAERIAHQLGEPLGTLVLTLSAILIEVSLIASVMLVGKPNPALARDTMYAVMMLILNGLLGVSLLAGGFRHHQQEYNLQGARSFMVVLLPLAALALILPNYTVSSPGATLSPGQAAFFGAVTLALYGVFLALQTQRHKSFFEEVNAEPTAAPAAPAAHPAGGSRLAVSMALLVLTLAPVALLAHDLAGIVEFGTTELGAPQELAGVLIAALILAPEGITAFKAAWRNHIQRAVNIMLGSALSTIGLTVPVVLAIGLLLNHDIVLGLSSEHAFLLMLTLLVSTLTFSGSRTDMLKGAVHVVLFLIFIMLIAMP